MIERIAKKIIRFLKNINAGENILKLIICINIIYIGYLLIIGYYNPLLVDDFAFMAKLQEYGLFGSIDYWYNNWQGRFAPQFLINLIIIEYKWLGTTLPYILFVIALYIYSLPKIFKHITQYNGRLICAAAASLLFNFFVLTNFEVSTLFWTNVSAMYVAGIGFALFGTAQILSENNNMINYFLIGLCFAYAGSSAEHFGAICTFILLLYVIKYILKFKNDLWHQIKSNGRTAKVLFAFAICLISFVIMLLAPGTEIRRSHFTKATPFDTIFIALESLNFLFYHIKGKIVYYLIFGMPFIYIGTKLRTKSSIDENKTLLGICLSLPIFIFFLYFCLVPTAYAISAPGPLRSMTHLAFYIAVYVAACFFLIGYKIEFPRKLALFLTVLSCLMIVKVYANKIYTTLPDTIHYAKDHRERIKKLKKINEDHGAPNIVTLQPLEDYENNILWHSEISTDTSHWHNKAIKRALNLKFGIKLSEK